MLTKLTIRNFKRFGETQVEIELGNPVVFIGPNNSGKTSAMQALALWDIGLKRWNEKRSGLSTPEKRPGVAVSIAAISWPSRHRPIAGTICACGCAENSTEGSASNNIRIDIIVEGVTEDQAWTCGLEFDYANEESFYCRPLRLSRQSTDACRAIRSGGHPEIAFCRRCRGWRPTETLPPGAVDVRNWRGAHRRGVAQSLLSDS